MSCRGRVQLLTVIAFLTASGCKGEGPSGPVGDEALPESHPAATDNASSSRRPVWSENGAELGYVLSDNRTAVARSGGTGSRRELFAVAPPAQILGLELSRDASEWFTISASGVPGALGTTIRRHTASSTEVVTDRGGTPWTNGAGRAVLTAANGDFAYIVRPDSLYFRRKTGGGAQFLGVGCVGLAAISPTGDGVICYRAGGLYSALRFSTSAPSSPTEISGSESGAYPKEFLWNDQGIYMIFGMHGSHFAFERHSDPQSKFATPRPAGYESSGFLNASIALDGRSFAFVNSYCTPSRGLYFGCEIYQLLIYHADAVTRTTKRLAVHATLGGDVIMSISPDGKRIAYTLDQGLYVVTAN